ALRRGGPRAAAGWRTVDGVQLAPGLPASAIADGRADPARGSHHEIHGDGIDSSCHWRSPHGKLESSRLSFWGGLAMANMQGAPGTDEKQKSALEQYGVDLTEIARTGKLDPVIGRDAEIRRISQVLTRRTKNNPVIIGEPGVGKTAVVEGLAQRIVAGDVADSIKDKRLGSLDLAALVAGATYSGATEGELQAE